MATLTVLDYTKSKPISKSEVSIGKAEEFLAGLLDDDDPKLKQVRKRLFEDFSFYAKAALSIRTKTGQIQRLVLNPAQKILDDAVRKQLDAEGKVRIIILKARQQGLSTYTGGYLYFSFHSSQLVKPSSWPTLLTAQEVYST